MIVAFSGQAGSGKDTSSDFLVRDHGFVKVAFADLMKRVCASIYKYMTREHLWGPSEMRNKPIENYPREHGPWVTKDDLRCVCCNVLKEGGDNTQCFLTARWALQSLGTEWGRSNYSNTWIDPVLDIYHKLCHQSGILRSVHYSYTPWDGLVSRSVPNGPKPTGVVISDLRWPAGNEGQSIKREDGILVKLLRGDGLVGAAGMHESEQCIGRTHNSTFDHIIDNREYSLEQLSDHLNTLFGHRI